LKTQDTAFSLIHFQIGVNSMKSNLLKTTLVLSLAVTTGPLLAAGPSIPPSDPPYCDIPNEIDSKACISLIYSIRRCPDYDPFGPIDPIGSLSPDPGSGTDTLTVCLDPMAPIPVQIECDTSGETTRCEAYPKGLPESSYAWQVTGQLVAVVPEETDVIEVACAEPAQNNVEPLTTHGTLNLFITNPYSGVTTSSRVPATCTHGAAAQVSFD